VRKLRCFIAGVAPAARPHSQARIRNALVSQPLREFQMTGCRHPKKGGITTAITNYFQAEGGTRIGSLGTSVATDTWGQDKPLKFSNTCCEY
jgi:hypothetical protein